MAYASSPGIAATGAGGSGASCSPTCAGGSCVPSADVHARGGAVVALTHRSAVDDPSRFTSSGKVGPWVGMTQSRNQSGDRDVSGGITKAVT